MKNHGCLKPAVAATAQRSSKNFSIEGAVRNAQLCLGPHGGRDETWLARMVL